MPRPLKQGIDYFPMDVEMDDKVELIEAKYGIVGFGILIKLYQKIYKEGYYLNCNEETLLIFSKRINVNINSINEVINDCLCYNIFSENLYKKYSILTSSGIQKRYLIAIDRRKCVDLVKEYIIADINSINVNINWINSNISTQSKVKYSKVKESKIIYPWDDEKFINAWELWKKFKKEQFRFTYKPIGEQGALKDLSELSRNNMDISIAIIYQSIKKGWKGLFELKGNQIDNITYAQQLINEMTNEQTGKD